MSPFIYWIYFEKVGRPEKIIAKHYEEFQLILKEMIIRAGEMPEWIIRGYGR